MWGHGQTAISNISAITLTWHKLVGQEQLPGCWTLSWDGAIPALPSREPRRGTRKQPSVPTCANASLLSKGMVPRVEHSITAARRDELLNTLRRFFFILQKSLRAILMVLKKIGFLSAFFFSLLILFFKGFIHSVSFQAVAITCFHYLIPDLWKTGKLIGLRVRVKAKLILNEQRFRSFKCS